MRVSIAEVLAPVDVCVIGGGIAGATVAASLPPSLRVSVFARSGECSSAWAQGGIAAARGSDDAPRLHAEDTFAAGAGLNSSRAVTVLSEEAPAAVEFLTRLQVKFGLRGAKEGGHSRSRVWHPEGDASGRHILFALHTELARLWRSPKNAVFVDVVVGADRALGVILWRDGRYVYAPAHNVVLASGGYGGLWGRTTNPASNQGDAIAAALRLGIPVSDLEFVQYHPTAFAGNERPLALITEALRGAGARLLVNGDESIFEEAEGDLSTRDIVARAVARAQAKGVVTLDCRHLGKSVLERDFPTFVLNCKKRGLDPRSDLVPITPAVHYTMGGVVTDEWGRTECDGLFGVGECANTGLHGANRLASNSLAEGVVFGRRVAMSCDGFKGRRPLSLTEWEAPPPPAEESVSLVGSALDLGAGILRSERDAVGALEMLEDWEGRPKGLVLSNATSVARAVLTSILSRKTSVGSHWRTDSTDDVSCSTEFIFRGDKLEVRPRGGTHEKAS